MHFSATFRILSGILAVIVFSIAISSCGGGASSKFASQPPIITTEPANATLSAGQTANLSVSATGIGVLTFQWYQGATGDTTTPVGTNSSTFTSAPLAASTSFWVSVTNSGGTTESGAASITVVTPPPNAIPSTYMGMQMNGGIKGINGQQPWPVVPFGAVRLWDASVAWADLQTTSQPPDFTLLNNWFSIIHQNDPSADILYTFGRVPGWASSNPNDTTCGFAPGSCDAPSDLNADGTGPDQLWMNFVKALVSNSVGQIKYYELWDEMDNPPSWNGTLAQIVRMNLDAVQIIRSLDPNAVILTPSVIIEGSTGRQYLQNYLPAAAAFLPSIGGVAIHGYVQMSGEPLVPETITDHLTETKAILAGTVLAGQPLFDTEASWGDPTVSNPAFTDPDLQAAFVARMYLLQWSESVSRFYWYQWNNKQFGTLWTPDPNNPAGAGTVLEPGVAYGQVYQWLVGDVMTQACGQSGPIWTCGLTSLNGYQALAIWDTSQSCTNGSCSTSSFTFASPYVQYRDLAGNTTSLSGQTAVPIGAKPILLENQNR